MILVDTSVWISHLRNGETALAVMLDQNLVLAHPWVIGELALGHLSDRDEVIALLAGLSQATVATTDEVLTLTARERLDGSGIGYVDAQLIASTLLTRDSAIWSHDRHLVTVAKRLGVAFEPSAVHLGGSS